MPSYVKPSPVQDVRCGVAEVIESKVPVAAAEAQPVAEAPPRDMMVRQWMQGAPVVVEYSAPFPAGKACRDCYPLYLVKHTHWMLPLLGDGKKHGGDDRRMGSIFVDMSNGARPPEAPPEASKPSHTRLPNTKTSLRGFEPLMKKPRKQ
ncbi:hypothetical protein MRX96_057109 [Rhipicephalus microplus]